MTRKTAVPDAEKLKQQISITTIANSRTRLMGILSGRPELAAKVLELLQTGMFERVRQSHMSEDLVGPQPMSLEFSMFPVSNTVVVFGLGFRVFTWGAAQVMQQVQIGGPEDCEGDVVRFVPGLQRLAKHEVHKVRVDGHFCLADQHHALSCLARKTEAYHSGRIGSQEACLGCPIDLSSSVDTHKILGMQCLVQAGRWRGWLQEVSGQQNN